MKSWGVTFLILGVGTFVLPIVGLEFTIMSLFGDERPMVAILLAIAGLLMVWRSSQEGKQVARQVAK